MNRLKPSIPWLHQWRSSTFCFAVAVLVLFVSGASARMVLSGGYDATRHDRDGSSFFGDGYDWSGVCTNSSKRATMISPSYFLTREA